MAEPLIRLRINHFKVKGKSVAGLGITGSGS